MKKKSNIIEVPYFWKHIVAFTFEFGKSASFPRKNSLMAKMLQ